jgi:hypothetical protein
MATGRLPEVCDSGGVLTHQYDELDALLRRRRRTARQAIDADRQTRLLATHPAHAAVRPEFAMYQDAELFYRCALDSSRAS